MLRHEQQHNETMLQTLQLARLDGLPPARLRPGQAPGAASAGAGGLELIEIPAGPCTIGARAEGFAYDNERPRHRTDVRGYLIGRTPITNATYLTFVEGGGYERREWWSKEGFAWKEDYDITRPGGWTPDLRGEWRLSRLEPLHPDRPVVHLSWFEADAFARAHGLRLPTETEWEKAATWDQEQQVARRIRGETRRRSRAGTPTSISSPAAPSPCRGSAAGASPYGCLAMIGDVWEWTSIRVRRLRGLFRLPLPRILRGVLRQGIPSPARGIVGDASARRRRDLPQLGLSPAPPDLLRAARGQGLLT